ncbi:MAG TPA: hypothetical protein ENI65_00145 [Gammaproteobacteria bacterium]|nr:hypothetical protein [Gammaproteobacteria bacterium]
MKKRIVIIGVVIIVALAGFFTWRFIRPMNIFVVDDRFAWPIDTSQVPPVLGKLSASECGACHQTFYKEWRTTIHSQAWVDPYFQTDWKFDDAQHTCRLCHTPLDRQQPHKVLGYRDTDKWDPILEDNPDFDPKLQHEGVTCPACHYRDGKIVGVFGNTSAPHPVKKLQDPNEVCVRCHIVEGDRWDTFFRFPPCGTVAEINSTLATVPDKKDLEYLVKLMAEKNPASKSGTGASLNIKDVEAMVTGKTGEVVANNTRTLGCVQCHMPLAKRPLVEGGVVRNTRQHLWRGGHDPKMVRKALSIAFVEEKQPASDKRLFRLTVANTGAAHYVPTGTPDRHLTVHLRLLDKNGGVIDEQSHTIIRTVMWRPFIVDLWDTRLPRWQPRRYKLEVPAGSPAVKVEAEIRYHLLAESRRKRIGYKNKTPINYEVYRKQIPLLQRLKGTENE